MAIGFDVPVEGPVAPKCPCPVSDRGLLSQRLCNSCIQRRQKCSFNTIWNTSAHTIDVEAFTKIPGLESAVVGDIDSKNALLGLDRIPPRSDISASPDGINDVSRCKNTANSETR